MLVAGGNPGMVKDIQVKVASARKVFRILKVRSRACFHDCTHTLPAVPNHLCSSTASASRVNTGNAERTISHPHVVAALSDRSLVTMPHT
jgi:hypothetical protein